MGKRQIKPKRMTVQQTGEYRIPRLGEYYYTSTGRVAKSNEYHRMTKPRIILKCIAGERFPETILKGFAVPREDW